MRSRFKSLHGKRKVEEPNPGPSGLSIYPGGKSAETVFSAVIGVGKSFDFSLFRSISCLKNAKYSSFT